MIISIKVKSRFASIKNKTSTLKSAKQYYTMTGMSDAIFRENTCDDFVFQRSWSDIVQYQLLCTVLKGRPLYTFLW